MLELRLRLALQFRNDALCQNFAQFDAPLVERVDLPDRALSEDGMFVKRDQFAQRFWRQPFGKIVFDGRFPSNTRCGTSQSGVPSAFTCSRVLPNASASACAQRWRQMS